ncbi:SpaH/EbpB family LPXTG-anchored major pilin [Corynebacterium ureicelerivorans]|uniref:SpaH/EbpB family LPXTG-anchored major pilin n=3 Tax=Corynebacterium TaxID=1716 RepID=UPI0026552CE9|nr:SpaH/EbpB family LPXTG-anchored major pilin [Corynebacterium ureicelerivorans]MCT1370167.1 SpaH/EbpB family LPXTG-anchored major pilin [Corynebacterium mucifaciens]MDN8627327.1 SpaH/EbpB family LPXTG-anchored major pilin [Corynebacterium ureicelerivorans]
MAAAIKKTAAIALAAGLTISGSAGIVAAPLAGAQNTTTPVVATNVPDASTIGTGDVTLTINKRVNPTELRDATGEADAAASGQPLAGVGFTAERLDVDITNQANFNRVAQFANDREVDDAREEFEIAETTTLDPTNEDGQTSATLPVGAYIITESTTPGAQGGEAYVPAEPFIVFLPMTNSEGTGWNRDVQVYPKNSYAKVTKTVTDEGKNAQSNGQGEEGQPGFLGARPAENAEVTYTLDGVVPAAPENRVLNTLTLTDASNSAELAWGDDFIQGVYVVRNGEEVAIDAANYTVDREAAVPTTNTEGLAAGADQAFTVTVDAQEAGLQPGDTVRVRVNATMLGDDAASKGIENSVRESFVFRNPSTGVDDEPRETPDDKVVTYVGNISVHKRGEDDAALAGAEFQIGTCNADQTGLEGDAIQTGVTDADGNLTFPGLHVTDYVNDAEVTDAVAGYCVVETRAPEGYATPQGKDAVRAIALTRTTANALNAERTAFDAAAAENVISNGAVIDNVRKTTPTLPSTGGMGVLVLALAGLAIIAGGVYAARRNSQSA